MSGFNLVQTGDSGTPILTPRRGKGDPFEVLHEQNIRKTGNEDFEFGRFDERYDNILQNEYLARFKRSIEDARKANRDFRSGFLGFNTSFDRNANGLSLFEGSMKRIVEFISAHLDFGGGAQRQTFFVNYGGWDNHEDLHREFNGRIAEVSFVLKAFRDALDEIGLLENVVLFSASDFGRTLTSNGGGSDHGWGGNAMILGGPVQGKRVLGEYPDMDLQGDQISNADRGNFIPTTSLEEYFTDLALWFGLDEEDLHLAFPNVGSFIPDGRTRPNSVGMFDRSA